MEKNLYSGDVLLLDRLTYKISSIKRNDVAAVYYEKDSKYLIKRIIGLPGDVVYFKDGKLYINDLLTAEPYLGKDVITPDWDLGVINQTVIPKDMYLTVGDNRTNSLDSRDPRVGLISKKDILGKVRLRIWPLNKLKIVK